MELTPELLLRAYASGIFPMGDDYAGIRWYSPDPRCIFDLDQFHVPKRLMRTYRQGIFTFAVDTAWDRVMQICSRRETDVGCWITDDIISAYTQLHQLGFAHSVEAYKDGELAGGLYGVSLRGAFFGESMFHLQRDASKVSLVYLVERLRERGYMLLDTQYLTEHLGTFGAICISKDDYMQRLGDALMKDCRFV